MVLLNAKSHNPEDSAVQIENIQQIVMAINALSKVFIDLSSFLFHFMYFSLYYFLFLFWGYISRDFSFPILVHTRSLGIFPNANSMYQKKHAVLS